MIIKEREYFCNGAKTNYYQLGKGQPLIFLHGAALGPLVYRQALEKLAVYFEVIAPDIPPFGKFNLPPEDWEFDDYGTYFASLIESLNLEKVILVGHSLGGGIAASTAISSKRVKKLILINPAAIPIKKSFLQLSAYFFKTSFNYLRKSKKRKVGFSRFRHVVYYSINNIHHVNRIFKYMARVVKTGNQETLEKIEMPTLILWGKPDLILPDSQAIEIHTRIKNSNLKLLAGGHEWCLFQPEKLVELINKFTKIEAIK
ncbi:MAG TPA: alpha/beta hydrolase [Candidatus Bathyarchaeia archaeon]|nr:alpha/beta hydrolase [Candidatus Bathyarchaeia archaeon]